MFLIIVIYYPLKLHRHLLHQLQHYMSPVKRICVFEHSVMTNFNCACPAIQRGQGSGFLSEGSSWLTARIGDKYQIRLMQSISNSCELLHGKTNKITCAPGEDSDQTSLPIECTAKTDQTGQSRRWAHMSFCWFLSCDGSCNNPANHFDVFLPLMRWDSFVMLLPKS